MCYKSLLRNAALLFVACLLTFTSCRKSNSTTSTALTNSDDNGGYASDAAKVDNAGNDVVSIADAAAVTGASNLRTTATTLGGCATVTNDTVSTPHVLTIDFGTTDCTCADLRIRRGKIIVTYSGHYKDSGSSHTISYSNYYVDDMQLTGHKTVTNMGMNSSGQYWYSVDVADTLHITTDTMVIWTGTRTRTWNTGYATTARGDDSYLIGGTTTLKRANGNTFTFTISSSDPLKVAYGCRWIESGTVTISSSSFTGGDRTLNYGFGGGGCDALAQVTIAGHTYDITLR